MTAVLDEIIQAQGFIARGCRWTALAGGKVNRAWRVSADNGDDAPPDRLCPGPDKTVPRAGAPDRCCAATVKLYAADGDSPLFPNDAQAEMRALLALSGRGIAPRPRGIVATPAGWCVVYDHVDGVRWGGSRGRPRDDGPRHSDPRPHDPARHDPALHGPGRQDSALHDPALVARALRLLHAQPPVPGLRRPPGLAAATEAMLAQTAGGAAIAAMRPTGIPPVAVGQVFLHGDPVPGNLICGPAGITLIDWQCPAIGDPADDVAMFLSPAQQWLARGRVLPDACRDRFLSAYGHPATVARYLNAAPWYHWRMAAHCLWRAERGQADYGAALRFELQALCAAS